MTTRFEHAYVLTVLSSDRPGIVSAVSSTVARLGGNIDACSQTVLSGYFTLITVVSFPKPVQTDSLAAEVRCPAEAGADLQVLAVPFDAALPRTPPSAAQAFVITAFGKDKPGVVHRFSQYLAGKDINIVDLYGHCSGEEFVLISQVEIPDRWDIAMLQADLEEMGRDEGFTVRLQHENVFVATNQLRLSR